MIQTLLTVIHVFVCFFLILVVLLQQGRGGGMGGAMGGATAQVPDSSSLDRFARVSPQPIGKLLMIRRLTSTALC